MDELKNVKQNCGMVKTNIAKKPNYINIIIKSTPV